MKAEGKWAAYEKAQKVIESCTTPEQLEGARKYNTLWTKQYVDPETYVILHKLYRKKYAEFHREGA